MVDKGKVVLHPTTQCPRFKVPVKAQRTKQAHLLVEQVMHRPMVEVYTVQQVHHTTQPSTAQELDLLLAQVQLTIQTHHIQRTKKQQGIQIHQATTTTFDVSTHKKKRYLRHK